MYSVYDSYGYLVRGGFSSYKDALTFKYTFGNNNFKIKKS